MRDPNANKMTQKAAMPDRPTTCWKRSLGFESCDISLTSGSGQWLNDSMNHAAIMEFW